MKKVIETMRKNVGIAAILATITFFGIMADREQNPTITDIGILHADSVIESGEVYTIVYTAEQVKGWSTKTNSTPIGILHPNGEFYKFSHNKGYYAFDESGVGINLFHIGAKYAPLTGLYQ